MNIIQTVDMKKMGLLAADIFKEAIRTKPDIVLGLATGSTPLTLYEELIRKNKEGEIDFSGVKTINLDEYVGLPGTHEQSYRYFMNDNLFNHININMDNTFVPDGMAKDADAECARYDNIIEKLGGLDLQLLGIGFNGHLGFNEPSDTFSNKTQCIKLTESTVNANARFFSDISEVPKSAITMGMKDIMLAKKIVLLAGAEKKDIIEKALYGEITPKVPASVLQMHQDVTIVLVSD